jgi:hypothetical protein
MKGSSMSKNDRNLRNILAKLKKVLSELSEDDGDVEPDLEEDVAANEDFIACTPKVLPTRILIPAAKTAAKINPANAVAFGPTAVAGGSFAVDEPLRIAVLVQKYWGPATRRLTVRFLDSSRTDFKNKVLKYMNSWSRTCGISFVLSSDSSAQVRISTGAGGYYSYLGTDILHIPANRQTMNLEAFTVNTSDSEYKRVVQHEAGHTLGFPHEHMRGELVKRLDKEKCFQYFWETNRWDRQTVVAQVLTPLNDASIVGTPVDQDSIMCYQLPGKITTDGKPIRGGLDINATDATFAGRIYPKTSSAPASQAALSYGAPAGDEGDWAPSEDVTNPEIPS